MRKKIYIVLFTLFFTMGSLYGCKKEADFTSNDRTLSDILGFDKSQFEEQDEEQDKKQDNEKQKSEASSANIQEEEKAVKGTVFDNVYTNRTIGLEITFPEDWRCLSNSNFLEGDEAKTKDEKALRYMLYRETPDDDICAFDAETTKCVSVSFAKSDYTISAGDMYMDQAEERLDLMAKTAGITENHIIQSTTVIADITGDVLSLNGMYMERPIYQEHIFLCQNGYRIRITFMCLDEDSCSELEEMFATKQ